MLRSASVNLSSTCTRAGWTTAPRQQRKRIVTDTPDWSTNPKASAKAQKAYNKANRKWWQKKRWWLIIAIVVIIIIVAATSSGGGSSNGPKVVTGNGSSSSPSGKASSGSDKGAVGTQGNPAKIGQTIELAGTRYTVKKARTTKTLGDQQYGMGSKANGIFVVVTLKIENVKNETKTFTDSAAKFVASNGSTYSTDSNGTMATITGNQQPLLFADMQPNLPRTGLLVFDVPPSTLKGGLLKVSDLFGQGDAYINLRLK